MGMIYLSDEEMDISRVIQKWVSALPSDRQLSLTSWIDELFYKAIDYIININEYIVDTTFVGTVINGLSQIITVKSKQEFICGMVRGLGGNLSYHNRVTFAKDVFQYANERPPDLGSPLDCYADGSSYIPYTSTLMSKKDLEGVAISDLGHSFVVNTVSVQRTLQALEPLITNMEPFILIGPEGCGKVSVIILTYFLF